MFGWGQASICVCYCFLPTLQSGYNVTFIRWEDLLPLFSDSLYADLELNIWRATICSLFQIPFVNSLLLTGYKDKIVENQKGFYQLFFHSKEIVYILVQKQPWCARVFIIILDKGNLCSMVKTRVKEATLNSVRQLCPKVRLLPQGFLVFTQEPLPLASQTALPPLLSVSSYSWKLGIKRYYTQR